MKGCALFLRRHFAKKTIVLTAFAVSMLAMTGVVLAWNLTTASYDSVSKAVAGQDTAPQGLTFNSDGTKMYMLGNGDDRVYQYSLSTAWDLTTASYDSVFFSVTSQESTPTGVTFKSDGTKMYMLGSINDTVYQYSLSTGWDLSTASYDSVSFSVAGQDTSPQGLTFKSDGTKMYMVGSTGDAVYQYSLSSAWNMSTASYDSVSFSIAGQETTSTGLVFKTDGMKMYVIGSTADRVYQYSLSSAWDLSTASYDSASFNVTTHDTSPQEVAFKSDGTKMYMVGATNDATYQYSLTAWSVSTASYDSVSFRMALETAPSGIAFKSDGTKMFVTGSTNDHVDQYSLTSAWDLSTALYHGVSFNITSQEGTPTGITFKTDGTKMYTIGSTGDAVDQYSLSSAWDISTASYDSVTFSVNAQDATPQGIAFKDDGTKMYMIGATNDTIYQYSLSSAWVVSSASYDSVSFSVSGQDGTANGVAFKTDGLKMYMVGATSDDVFQYTLSSAWDLSTASYDGVSFDMTSQETAPQEVAFKSNGAKMYMVGVTNDTVYQYSMTIPDTTAPVVQTLSPADNATGISATANLVITFDEFTRAGTGTLTIKKVSDDSTVETITVSGALLSGNGTTQLTLNPSTTLSESTAYYIAWTANAFKDTTGNHVAAQTSTTYWNFTIGDATAPSADSFSPADNATGVSVTTNLSINFNETTRAGTGTLSIKRTSDNSTVETITVSGAQLSGNGSTQLTLDPATTLSGSTTYYVTWNAKAFKDTSGNHAAVQGSTTLWNFTTADVTAPTVTALSPLDNATNVSTTANLVLTFDETTRAGTGTLTIKKTSDDSTVETITVSGALLSGNGSTSLTLNPATTLSESTSYYVIWNAKAFKDTSANHVAAQASSTYWNFTTGDFTAPSVSTFSPADGETDVAVTTNLVIVFDQIVQGGTGTIVLKKSSDDSVVEMFTTTGGLLSGSGSTTITINPSVTLANSTSYYVTIHANAFRDVARNFYAGISDSTTWNFTTVAAAPPPSSSSSSSTEEEVPVHVGSGGRRGTVQSMAQKIAAARMVLIARFNRQIEESRMIAQGTDEPDEERGSSSFRRVTPRLVTRTDPSSSASSVSPSSVSSSSFSSSASVVSSIVSSAPSIASSSAPPPPRVTPPRKNTLPLIAERRGRLLAIADDHQVLYGDVIITEWYAPYVSLLIEEKIAQGYRDAAGELTGEFGVGKSITRSEMLKMALEAAGQKEIAGATRNVSARGTWAAAYVATAEALGLSIFLPGLDVHAPATRGEVIQTILEALNVTIGKTPPSYIDVPADHPHAYAISAATFFGLVEGDRDESGNLLNRFRPDAPITREEVAKIVALAREVAE